MNARNFVSESNLAEHYGDCGFHLVEDEETEETEEPQSVEDDSEAECLLISEVREPFDPEYPEPTRELQSPVEDYLRKVKARFEEKEPKVALIHWK